MFNVNVKNRRVVIEHRAKASNGGVSLHTTFDFHDVPMERIFEWAARNRLQQLIPDPEVGRRKISELKRRFDNLVIDCKEPRQSYHQAERRDEEMMDNLRTLVKEGASFDRLIQFLIRSTRNRDH